jgi:hypothetical protein
MKGTKDLYVGSFYRPPHKIGEEYIQRLQSLITRIPTSNGAHMWLGADFNLGDINWEDESLKPLNASHARECRQLLTVTRDSFLEQMVLEPSRVTETMENTLDLFFTNNSTLINKVEIIPGMSDHKAVYIESNLRPVTTKTAKRKVNQYRKADFQTMKEELEKREEEFIRSSDTKDAQDLWIDFKNIIHDLMEKYVPTKTINGSKNHKRWVNKDIKRLIHIRNKLFKKHRKSKEPSDRMKYKATKADLQKATRNAHWKHIEDLIDFGDLTDLNQPNKRKSGLALHI